MTNAHHRDTAHTAKTLRAWPVFVFFVCLYAISLGHGFYSSDGDVMFKTTAALVANHTFALDPDPGLPQIVAGQGGVFYSKYDPGLPMLAIPFYAAGDWIAQINAAHRYRVAALFVLLLPVLTAAAAVAALAGLADDGFSQRTEPEPDLPHLPGPSPSKERGSTAWATLGRIYTLPRNRLIAVIAAGLATPLWVYARTLFAETVLTAALTWAVALIHHRDTEGTEKIEIRGGATTGSSAESEGTGTARLDSAGWLFIAGIVSGIGMLTRAAFAIYLPALAWLIIRLHPAQRLRDHAFRLAILGGGIVPSGAILLWHNELRFGDLWQFGYAGEGFTTPAWQGVIGLLFSPGKSVFLYAPPLIMSAILWPRFRRVYPALGEFLVVAWGGALVFYGSWWAWHGGWCWGPRFLVPLGPLSCLPLVMLPDFSGEGAKNAEKNQTRERRKRLFHRSAGLLHMTWGKHVTTVWHRAAWALIVLGIAIQVGGVLTDITPHYVAHTPPGGATDYGALHTDPGESALAYAAGRVIAGDTEPLALFHLDETGLPPTWTTGVPILLCLGCARSARRIVNPHLRARKPRPRA